MSTPMGTGPMTGAAQPVPRGRDWPQAGLVLLLTAMLIGIPAVLAARVGIRVTEVPPGESIELSAPGEDPDTISFAEVGGWLRRATGDRTTAVLDGPDGAVLLVTVVNGVTDFPAAEDWRLKVLGLQAFEATFDGGEITTGSGFRGHTCRATVEPGVCAIVGRDKLAVTLALRGDQVDLPVLLPIVESLRVRS